MFTKRGIRRFACFRRGIRQFVSSRKEEDGLFFLFFAQEEENVLYAVEKEECLCAQEEEKGILGAIEKEDI